MQYLKITPISDFVLSLWSYLRLLVSWRCSWRPTADRPGRLYHMGRGQWSWNGGRVWEGSKYLRNVVISCMRGYVLSFLRTDVPMENPRWQNFAEKSVAVPKRIVFESFLGIVVVYAHLRSKIWDLSSFQNLKSKSIVCASSVLK